MHVAAAGVLTAMLPNRTSARALDRYVSDLTSLSIKLLARGYIFIEPPFSGWFCRDFVVIHDSNDPDAPIPLIKPGHRAGSVANRSGKADSAMCS